MLSVQFKYAQTCWSQGPRQCPLTQYLRWGQRSPKSCLELRGLLPVCGQPPWGVSCLLAVPLSRMVAWATGHPPYPSPFVVRNCSVGLCFGTNKPHQSWRFLDTIGGHCAQSLQPFSLTLRATVHINSSSYWIDSPDAVSSWLTWDGTSEVWFKAWLPKGGDLSHYSEPPQKMPNLWFNTSGPGWVRPGSWSEVLTDWEKTGR